MQPASTNGTPVRPPRRRKLNSVAPSEDTSNITIISHNKCAYVQEIDSDDVEEKSSNGVKRESSLHI